MGRPINRQKFLGSKATHQIQATVWGPNDTGNGNAQVGYLTKQNSTNRFRAHTVNGNSLTTLSNGTPTMSGYSAVKCFPVGSDPLTYATGTANLKVINATLKLGGNGYAANNTITLVGGTFGNAATITINSVFGNTAPNVYTLNTVLNQGYSVLPSNLANVTTTSNGSGTGATFVVNFGLESVNVATGGANYTSVTPAFPGATTKPTTTAFISAGSVVNNVAVNTPGVINVTPVVVFEGSSGTTEYVKYIQSATNIITFNASGNGTGNVYNWLYLGQPVPSDYANLSIKLAYLDTK